MKALLAGTLTLLVLAIGPRTQAQDDPLPPAPPVETRSDVVVPQADLDSAIAQAVEALKANPNDVAGSVKLGQLYIQKGDNDSAITTLSQAIKIDPTAFHAFFNRGRAYRRKGDIPDAMADYDEAIRLNPQANGAYTNRGQIYERQGNYDQAIADESASIAINARHSIPFNVRANCYARKGKYEKAAADYLASIQISPNFNLALNNYAWLLATCPQDSVRDGKTALDYAMKVCDQTHWRWAAPIDTLAAAYAETGDFDNAINWENKFLEYPISATTAEKARARLELYKNHQPFRRDDETPTNEDDGN